MKTSLYRRVGLIKSSEITGNTKIVLRDTALKISPRFYSWPKSIYFWKNFTIKTISIDAVVTYIF